MFKRKYFKKIRIPSYILDINNQNLLSYFEVSVFYVEKKNEIEISNYHLHYFSILASNYDIKN